MFNLRSATLLVSLLALSPVSACSENGSKVVGARLMNVEVGMTQAQVLAIVGEPQRRETYGGTEFLIYPTGAANSSLDFIPIAIVNGRVSGIGRNVYDNVVRSTAQSDLKAAKK
jgi:hypothetical protein